MADVSFPQVRTMSDELKEAVRVIYETFKRDEAQGYHTKDRVFVLEMLRPYLAEFSAPPVQDADNGR